MNRFSFVLAPPSLDSSAHGITGENLNSSSESSDMPVAGRKKKNVKKLKGGVVMLGSSSSTCWSCDGSRWLSNGCCCR